MSLFAWKRPKSGFLFRSSNRDLATDVGRLESILNAVDKAMKEAEAEREGLKKRLAEVLARASVTIGAESDEYLTRDAVLDENQKTLGQEIRYAEGRLKRLDEVGECYVSFRAFVVSALRSAAVESEMEAGQP